MHYELNYGVPAIAVGLSAISFSASLQKDAAPIPNALAMEMAFFIPRIISTHNAHFMTLRLKKKSATFIAALLNINC